MSDFESSFERDLQLARVSYPEETDRLETLRAGFDFDFRAALSHAKHEGHLIRWPNDMHILAYEPGASPVGLLIRLDAVRQQIVDVAVVGQLICPSLVEVRYERQAPESPKSETDVRTRSERGKEKRSQLPLGYFEEHAYWGAGDYYGDPPAIPPGAVALR